MRATELQHERSLVTVRMSATDGTSATAQMLAIMWDATAGTAETSCRYINISMQTSNSDVN